jgi:hypothetical protein
VAFKRAAFARSTASFDAVIAQLPTVGPGLTVGRQAPDNLVEFRRW